MRLLGMQQRLAEEPSGGRARVSHEIGHGPRPDELAAAHASLGPEVEHVIGPAEDRKSTRLNSSHVSISYAVFCLKKKTTRHIKVTEKEGNYVVAEIGSGKY